MASLIADSGAIYALYDADDSYHVRLRDFLASERGAMIIPMVILSEIGYLLQARLGIAAELRFLHDISIGAFTLEPFLPADVRRCRALLQTYADLRLGLADATVIATAERLGVRRILTVDERDFRAVRSSSGTAFTLLPADA
jgi:predicted nucleic acid-binding protein